MPSSRLSYRQRHVLWEIKATKGEGLVAGNTNATLCALERRGLVKSTYLNDHTFRCNWKLTPTGVAALV